MKTQTSYLFKYLAMALCLGIAHTAQAATRNWANAVDGNFSDSTNWSSSAVPGTNDLANFNTSSYADGSEFAVTLTGGPITNQNFRLSGTNATTLNFNLNGGSYTTTLTGGGDSRVGNDAGVVVLNLYGGGSFNAGNLNIGNNAAANGTINVFGAGTSLNISAASAIGSSGRGTLNVYSNGTYSSTTAITVANGSTSTGNVKITGTGSKFSMTSDVGLVIGAQGTASLVVENGGSLTNAGANSTAVIRFSTTSGTSTAEIKGTGSKLEGGNIDIGGNASAAGGSAIVTVSDGGDFKARGAIQLWNTSELVVNGGKASSGGDFTAYSGSEIGMVFSGANAVPFVAVGGNLTLSGGDITLSLSLGSSPSFNINDTIRLFGYGGTLSGTFSNYTEGQLFQLGGYDMQFSYVQTSGADTFIGLTVVPEPSVVALLAAGAAMLAPLVGRRRRK